MSSTILVTGAAADFVRWYLDNGQWSERVMSGEYRLGRPGMQEVHG